ncbi:MAG: hypothetical protein Q4D02_02145 [Clostridia bacterium]|nr:hypothetical protein [Clostridia bacterium]
MEGLEEKIFGKSKKDLEMAVQETIALTSKTQREFEKSQQAIKDSMEFDDTNKMLIEYYDKKTGNSDIQSELAATFVEGGMEKLQEREQERNLEALNLPEGVDEKTKQEALEKLKKEGRTEELTDEELQSEIYKAIYEEVFQEYSQLMMQVKTKQIADGSLTVGDKEGTKLVIYERYLTGIEMANHKMGGERFSNDPRISELRSEFKKEFDEKQKQVDDVTREGIDELKQLYDEKNEIAEDIQYFTLNPHLATPEQMMALRERYMQVSFEIREQDPSLEEYSRQIDGLEENQRFAEREGIRNSSTDRDVAGMSMDSTGQGIMDEPSYDESEKNNDIADTKDNIEDIKELEKNEEDLQEERKKEFIRRYNDAKQRGDVAEMDMLILQYRNDLDVDRLITDDTDRSNREVANDEYEYSDYIGGLDAVNNDDEIIDAMDKRADETLETDEKSREDEGISRTRNSNGY